MASNQETLTDLISSLADSLGKQLEMHVELAKAEVKRDVKELSREAMLLALALPLFAAGYMLVCVAAAMTIALWIAPAAAFAIVGVVNLGGAGAVVLRARQRSEAKALSLTMVPEIKDSARRIKGAIQHTS